MGCTRRLYAVPHTRHYSLQSLPFGLFLMNSITNDFGSLLHSRIDSEYCSDGPLLLITMCQHTHRNHLAFLESIKNKIHLATLAEYDNDVPKFLRFLNDNLKLISSTGALADEHNDLIPICYCSCALLIFQCFSKLFFDGNANILRLLLP
jgi:hypothetical protein